MIYRFQAPDGVLLSLEDLRNDLQLDDLSDGNEMDRRDAEINGYLSAAVDFFDGPNGWLGQCILSQKWAESLPASAIKNNQPMTIEIPLVGVTNVALSSFNDGSWTILDGASFNWCRSNETVNVGLLDNLQTRVEYTAGWGDAAAVPNSIKQAVRVLVRSFFFGTDQENAMTIAKSIASPYRFRVA